MPTDATTCGHPDILLKLPRRSGPPLVPGNTSEPGSAPAKTAKCSRSAGMIASGMPTTRRPALDLGGPSSISPVERSIKSGAAARHRWRRLTPEFLRTLRPEDKGQAAACPDRMRAIPCKVRVGLLQDGLR